MKRLTVVLWAAMMAFWVAFATLMATRGPDLLHWIHFQDPDPERRARALQVRELRREEIIGGPISLEPAEVPPR